jgi:hypothetical protein
MLLRAWAIAVLCSTALASSVQLPDPRTGNVGGISGVLFWPGEMFAANGDAWPLPTAAGCEVHFVPYSDLDRELVHPCGEWVALPSAGHYGYWLETDSRMTPAMGLLLYGRKPFAGHGMASIVPVTPAGRVSVPAGRSMPDSETLRLLSIEARNRWSERVFDRRVAAARVHTPVQMPEGRVVAGRFDRRTNDAIALTRPFDVVAGKTAVVWPAAPAESDLLLVLTKPPELQLSKPFPAQLALDQRAPDVMLNAYDRIIAIWYGVAARHATLSMRSDAAFWPARQVDLVRGKVTTIRSAVQRPPKVRVSIVVPPGETIAEPMSLDMAGRHLDAAPGAHEINGLPAAPLKITLLVGKWHRSEIVDLSSGADADVTFELKPIRVTGTVYYGDVRAQAEIDFLDDGDWRTVGTNERGEYATTFWWPKTHMARVKIGELPPYLEPFRDIVDSGVVDFHVPRTDYLVRVRDAKSGKGVPHAQLTIGNEADGGPQTSQRVTANADGVAVVPPLRRGLLIVSAYAARYKKPEPLRVQVDGEHRELDIALEPEAVAATLQLRLPDGAPAAHAEAWALDAAMRPLWRGGAGDDGNLELPEIPPGALLLVRHPTTASTIRPWMPNELAWTLEPPGEPLTVASRSAAFVALWLDGVRLSGAPLAFAAWSAPGTNNAGRWIGRNLPAKPLRVLLLPASALGSNAYDNLARAIEYPWPAQVSLPPVQ